MGWAPQAPPALAARLLGSPFPWEAGGAPQARHKSPPSRVTTLCSVTPVLYRHPEDVINSLKLFVLCLSV